jgi:hypothetical protein
VSIQQAAQAAVVAFGTGMVSTTHGHYPLAVVMVAIAGAESGWNASAQGDYGLGGPTCGNSSTSWGLWQIHNVHSAYLTQVTGSSNPCIWKQWLFSPANNATAAASVYRSQGFGAWTTYTSGAYAAHLAAAQAAVTAVTAPIQTLSATQPAPGPSGAGGVFVTAAPSAAPWTALAVGGGIGAVVAAVLLWGPAVREAVPRRV